MHVSGTVQTMRFHVLLLLSFGCICVTTSAVPDPVASPIAEPFPIAAPQQTVYYSGSGASGSGGSSGGAPENVYAPFSGAVYVMGVGPQGNAGHGGGSAGGSGGGGTPPNTGENAFSSASPAICPNNAPQGCGNLQVWNWCCPAGHTCAWLSDSVVGCCPPGCTCNNTNKINNPAATITQTVNVAAVAPTYVQGNSPPAAVGPDAGAHGWNGPGYCSTLYAHGPDLPTTAAGPCGTILVLNTGSTVRPWVGGRRALAGVIAAGLAGLAWLV